MIRPTIVVCAILLAGSVWSYAEDSKPTEDFHAKYKELCAVWEKTDKTPEQTLTTKELELVRYWIGRQPDVYFGHDFLRMAAITAGNAKDIASYDALEKIYLDSKRMEIVRAEAFRAIAKIDPKKAAHYVIKELSAETPYFTVYAEIALKEAYSTSVTQMHDNVMKSFRGGRKD